LLLEIETLSRNGEKLIFNESALIYEANLEDGYDAIVVVDTPDELRYQRLRKSRSMTDSEIKSRIDRQIAQSEKRKAADFVIDNSGDFEKLEKAVNFILIVAQAMEPKDFSKLPIDDDE